MRALLTISLMLAALANPAEAGRVKRKARIQAVIDRTVGGKVVSRTVVTGRHGRRAARRLTPARERSAARKGWSITEESAPEPNDLTLRGRLVESGFRAQRRGQSVITLTRPDADQLSGERETHVYAGGRRTRIRHIPSLAERSRKLGGLPLGHGRRVSSMLTARVFDLEAPKGEGRWVSGGTPQLEFDPADPYAVTLEVEPGVAVVIGRDELAQALETGRGGDSHGDAWLRVSNGMLDIWLRGPTGRSVLRVSRKEAARFLTASQYSVPRGAEPHYIDIDRELRGILAE